MSASDLPEFIPTKETNAYCSEECICPIEESEPEKLDTDRRLHNWNMWLTTRKDVHAHLGKSLNRTPGDLLMNAYEDYRSTREDKLVIDYTKILTPPDPQRGSPCFWDLPISLPNKCDHTQPTEYQAQISLADACEIPEITYVKVPDYIKEVKGVVPKKREGYDDWNRLKYKNQRFAELSDKIKLIQPHKPDLSQLVIVGTPLRKPKPKLTEKIDPVLQEDKKESFTKEIKSNPLFIINGLELFESSSGILKTIVTFDYNIKTKKILTKEIILHNLSQYVIRFKFKKSKKQKLFRDIIPERKIEDQVFYFNKNEELVLPQQKLTFKFYFKTTSPSFNILDLQFLTIPYLCPDAQVIVSLLAFSDNWNRWEKCMEIKENFKSTVRDTKIKESLNEILRRIPYQKYKPLTYTYNKKKIFEAVNTYFDPYNRLPKYRYDKEIVDQLEEIYKKIRSKNHPRIWNLNILELKKMAKEYDYVLSDKEVEENIKKYHKDISDEKEIDIKKDELSRPTSCETKTLKKTSNKSSKDVIVKKKSKKEKSISNIKVGESKDGKTSKVEVSEAEMALNKKLREITESHKKLGDKETGFYQDVEALVKQLYKFPLEENKEQEKFEIIYMILCVHFDYLCEQIADLQENSGVKMQSDNYPELPDDPIDSPRLKFELRYEKYKEKVAIGGFYPPKSDKPFPDFLKDVPLEETRKRYRLYYNLPLEDEVQSKKDGKGKKGKKDKKGKAKKDKKEKKSKDTKSKKKGKGGSKKGKKAKSGSQTKIKEEEEEVDKYVVDPNFYPFGESSKKKNIMETSKEGSDLVTEDVTDTETDTEITTENEVSPVALHQYRRNLYLLFYTCLENAITKILDYLDSLEPEITFEQVKLIEDCNACGFHFKDGKDEKVELFDLRHALATEDLKKVCYGEPPPTPEVRLKDSIPSYATESQDAPSSLFEILRHYGSRPEISMPISYPETILLHRLPKQEVIGKVKIKKDGKVVEKEEPVQQQTKQDNIKQEEFQTDSFEEVQLDKLDSAKEFERSNIQIEQLENYPRKENIEKKVILKIGVRQDSTDTKESLRQSFDREQQNKEQEQEKREIFTETSNAIVNPDWSYYKSVAIQKDTDDPPPPFIWWDYKGSEDWMNKLTSVIEDFEGEAEMNDLEFNDVMEQEIVGEEEKSSLEFADGNNENKSLLEANNCMDGKVGVEEISVRFKSESTDKEEKVICRGDLSYYPHYCSEKEEFYDPP